MELGPKMKEAIGEVIDSVGSLIDASIDEVVEAKLQELVDDTSTPFDNIAKDAVYPVLEAKLKEELKKKLEELKSKI